ncbi:hypothetical protein M409DRAFT_61842 [Zasmidium cellare ATCC 36951]|uniref:Major facilitator superfamily (MFS) profile domain-containing protein n=1 Tax=Zasmidium cellare ATCC 36951 TaxID=1080233 RepID=A0A6A6D232_ZASCE|nr:uncharacterized protein M409DRAFT_61842 [Zasmidium cellare ATCC 36951]KAF2173431.1 hypothetical protein M409DRAFT_61842 [Zasmidium cellare ATCC 36951]
MQERRGESSSHGHEERVGLLAECDGEGEDVEMDDFKQGVSTKNPLHGIPNDQLLASVRTFVQTHSLDADLSIFLKAALIAQSPTSLPELTNDERLILQREQTHRWSQPFILYLTIVMNSLGAVIQGWDQTGSNGANLSFPQEFGIADTPPYCSVATGECARRTCLVGFVNSAPFIAIAFFAAWISDPLNERVARRGTIFIGCIFSLLAPIGSAFAQNWGQLVACRILLGIGMGLKEVTVPVYGAECDPSTIRGGLVMTWQLFTALGVVLGLAANLAVHKVGGIAWRLQLGSACIPAVPLLLFVYLCPESPRWYLKKGKVKEAYGSLLRLRNTRLQAARDLYYIHAQLEQEKEMIKKSAVASRDDLVTRFIELFTVPRIRRATQASGIVMLAQQLCGINVIAFYSSTIFVQAGFTITNALVVSLGVKIAGLITTCFIVFIIDTFGRRALLNFTFPNMTWTLLATGLCFLIDKSSNARLSLIALFIFIFQIFYSAGGGPVPFTYSAECFPLSHREMGMSWAVATNNFWGSIVTLTLPRILAAFTPAGTFGFYGGLNTLALVLIFFFVPETKQRSLEELEYVFEISTSRHAAFQVQEQLPWWFRRWILRRRGEAEPQLYRPKTPRPMI